MPLFTVDVFHTSLASITSAGWKHWRNTATSQVEGDIIRSEIFSGQQKGVKDFNSLNLPCCFISTEQLLSISRKFPNKTLGVQLVCLNQLILTELVLVTLNVFLMLCKPCITETNRITCAFHIASPKPHFPAPYDFLNCNTSSGQCFISWLCLRLNFVEIFG